MFKFGSVVMPSDDEKQLGNKRLRVQNYQIAAIISGQ